MAALQCNLEVSAKDNRMVENISKTYSKLSKKQSNLNMHTRINFSTFIGTSCNSSSRTKTDPNANNEFILVSDEDADDSQPSPSSTVKQTQLQIFMKNRLSTNSFVMQTSSFQKQVIYVKIAPPPFF